MVISFSSDLAQLWDLKTFECKQKLSIDCKKNVEIVKICFAPSSNDIISIFKDDTIYVWSSENISLKCQFNSDENNKPFYKCFSISNDGKLVAVGSRNNYINIFNIESKELIKKIDLSQTGTIGSISRQGSTIKDCLILPGLCYDNKLLVVLTQEGLVDVYNIETGLIVSNLNSFNIVHNQSQLLNEQKITQIYSSTNSRYFSAITQDGYIQVYDLDFSNIKTMKATSGLMKSSINTTSTNSRFINENKQENQVIKKSISFHEQRSLNVSKRTQNLFDNSQIVSKLIKILKCYNEYPSRYRLFIWKVLLKLPENYESYASFVERGTHPAYLNLAQKYPVKSQKCIRLLEKTLSALAYWSPIFAECDYLPLLVFPFVKLYQNNQVVCFEICATFINNWCQYWFEYFPNPPMNILNMIENLLSYHDKILLEHFIRYRINCQIYGWCLLETIFSEVFSKHDWQILIDNIFSNHPGFLLYLVTAYSICNRTALIQVKEIDDAKYFFRHRNPITVNHLLNESFKMLRTTPSDIDPCKILKNFEPLTKGTYPVFNKQPKFITDYQMIEKTKILQQEINYLKERDAHLESHKYAEGKKLENEYLMKQMLWEKNQNFLNNKIYKQNLDEYERKQKGLESLLFKSQQESLNQSLKYPTNLIPQQVLVSGEPLISYDRDGNTLMNKMRKIDENFDDIQNAINKSKLTRNDSRYDDDVIENYEITSENDLKEIENEIISNRANALLENTNENQNKNDQSTSSLFSLERGRKNIEDQERETMKRIYELRKQIALESRNNTNVRSIFST